MEVNLVLTIQKKRIVVHLKIHLRSLKNAYLFTKFKNIWILLTKLFKCSPNNV